MIAVFLSYISNLVVKREVKQTLLIILYILNAYLLIYILYHIIKVKLLNIKVIFSIYYTYILRNKKSIYLSD